MIGRYEFDLDAYVERTRNGPCFVCKLVEGDPDFFHHIVYENEEIIVFLGKYPTMYGYTLVAPKEHKTRVTGDFDVEEYADFQRILHAVSEAVREEVGAERMYILSLGSDAGNAHVHWHVAPLPTGVPYEKQQFHALMHETTDTLEIPEEEKARLAGRIRKRVEARMRDEDVRREV